MKVSTRIGYCSSNSSRDVFSGEVDDGGYEVLPDEYGPDGAPVCGWLTNQQADALHGHLDRLGRIGQGTNLNQLLLPYRLDSYKMIDRESRLYTLIISRSFT